MGVAAFEDRPEPPRLSGTTGVPSASISGWCLARYSDFSLSVISRFCVAGRQPKWYETQL